MGFLSYAKYSVWDFVLCAIASCCLSCSCFVGFKATHVFMADPLPAILLCVVLTAAFFAIAYRPNIAAAGSVALVVLICAGAVAGWQASGTESLLDDVEGNYAYLVVLCSLCSAAVFMLSRKRAGAVVLLVGGLFLCAIMEYLYWGGHLVEFVLFGLSAAALLAYRRYQAGLRGSDTEQLSFGSAVIAAVVVVALATGLSAGVFAVCIAPLDPPNVIVKLLTKHVRMDEEHLLGVGDAVDVENDDLTSSDTNDRQNPESDENANGSQDQQQNMDDSSQSDDNTVDDAGSAVGLDEYMDHDAGQAVNTSMPDWAPFLMGFLVIALVAAIIAGRKYLRRRRVEALRALPPDERVRGMFLLLLGKLRRMKVPEPECQTLNEYLVTVEPMMARFEQLEGDAKPQWNELVATYALSAYGKVTPSDGDLATFDTYYGEFYRRARRYVGNVRYPVMFFRI